MPSKMQPAPPWQAILEDMRSQNRATIEAVAASRLALEQRIDRLDLETRSRDTVLELAIRELRLSVQESSMDIRELKTAVQQNSADTRDLSGKVEALIRLEERVSALERRSA